MKTRKLSAQMRYFRIVTYHFVKDDKLALRLYLFVLLIAAGLAVLNLLWDSINVRIGFSPLAEEVVLHMACFVTIFALVDRAIFPLILRHFLKFFGFQDLMGNRSSEEVKLANHIRPAVPAGTPIAAIYFVAMLGALIFFLARFESNLIQRLTPSTKSTSLNRGLNK